MKVAVADDSPSMVKIVARMLNILGYEEVVEFPTGVRAWEYIRAQNVDLLLTDCNMPVMSGLELTRKVRERFKSAELPIIMFTTLKSKEDIMAAVKAGVNGYLVKPFNQAQLKAQLDKVLGRKQGSDLQEQATRIAAGNHRRLSFQDSQPLVILGEKVAALQELADPANQSYTRSLGDIIDTIEAINRVFPDLELIYFLDSDSNNLVRQIRQQRKRLKLLLLSNDIGGGGVTMARLARINQTAPLSVGLVVRSVKDLSRKERDGLQKVGVLLLERPQVDRDFLNRLFREQVVAQIHGVPAEKPTPEQIVERIETDISLMIALPVLPIVYHRIIKLARYRNSDIQEWIEAVKTDPLSSAMIIRRANSPLYGFKTKVTDIGKAVTLLGKSTVKELIVSDALKRSFSTTKEAGFRLEDYWTHSLAAGLIARILSFPTEREQWDAELRKEFESWELSDQTMGILQSLGLDRKGALAEEEDAFVGGMMHDIGKVALVHCYPGLFPALLEVLGKEGWKISMGAAEEEVAGVTHVQVGQILARNWGLDEKISQVIAAHHAPAGGDRFVQLIGLANFLAGAAFPYPGGAGYPPTRAMEGKVTPEGLEVGVDLEDEGQRQGVEAFLPEGLLGQLGLELGQVLQLGLVICPDIRQLVGKIRSSMQD